MPGIHYSATGPDVEGWFHAGYWSGGFHREPEFRSMQLCRTKAQAEEAVAVLAKEARVRDEAVSGLYAAQNRRVPKGFYSDNEV